MIAVTGKLVNRYLSNDFINVLLDKHNRKLDEQLVCQKWLRESAAKRYIYSELYEGLLDRKSGSRVLDVGGGLTSLTRLLNKNCYYKLIDILAHDDMEIFRGPNAETDVSFIHEDDWYEVETKNFDLVIANDLFPNVDQRLDLFLKKYLPVCGQIRLCLTWYNNERFYKTKRVNAEEILFVRTWDVYDIDRLLNKFRSNIIDFKEGFFNSFEETLYENGRLVGLVTFKGSFYEER